jgi:lauroyl/myristoyl acyltransferase
LASWNALIVNLLSSIRDEDLTNLLPFDGLHHIEEIRQQDKTVLLLGFHYGAYGFAVATALAASGYPTRLVAYGDSHSPRLGTSRLYQKLYWPKLQRLIQKIRAVTVDPGNQSQPELRRVLEQRDEIVYLLADQYFVIPPGQEHSSHLVPLRFLHHTVYLDVSGVHLAKQMGAQPLTALPVRDGYRQRVLIEPMEWASGGKATVDIAKDLQVYLARLERHLMADPAWWRDLRRADLLPRMGVFEEQGSASGGIT